MENKIINSLIILIICFILLILSALAGICFGSVNLSPCEVLFGLIDGSATADGRIIYCVRLPRVMAAVLAGSALAVSGTIIQSVLGNPLASPNIIGVNSGAGFFTVLCMAVFPMTPELYPTAAFAGALGAVMTVYFISRKTGASKITLVLAGVAISSLFSAGTDTITTFFPDTLTGISAFKIGGVGSVTIEKLMPAWIYIIVGILAAIFMSHEIDILSLGDSTAHTLGMNVKLIRFILLMISALLAGSAVSFAGLLGFVGLIVPHAARRIIGNESKCLIPACALLGGTFVTVCDLLSRTVFAPHEIALGIVISYIGVPFFIYLLLKKKGGRHGA